MPRPVVAFPWGSRSTISVGRSASASPAAKLTAVVVFPTPPFWFTTARLLGHHPAPTEPHSRSRSGLCLRLRFHLDKFVLIPADLFHEPRLARGFRYCLQEM